MWENVKVRTNGFYVWLGLEPVRVTNSLWRSKSVLAVARFSGVYVEKLLMARLSIRVSFIFPPQAMTGRSCWPAVGGRPFVLHRILLEYPRV